MRVVIKPKRQPSQAEGTVNPSVTISPVGENYSGIPCISSWNFRPSEISRKWDIPSYRRVTLTCKDWAVEGNQTFWGKFFSDYRFLNDSEVDFHTDEGVLHTLYIKDWTRRIPNQATLTLGEKGEWDREDQIPPKRNIKTAFDADDTKILLFGDYRQGYYREREDDKVTLVGEVVAIGKELLKITAVKTDALVRNATEVTVERGYRDTEQASIKQNRSVEVCWVFSNENVLDVIKKIVEESGFETNDTFNTASAGALGSYQISGVLYKPTEAKKVLKELCEVVLANLLIDKDGKVGIRHVANVTQSSVQTFGHDKILNDTLRWTEDILSSVPRINLWYNLEIVTDFSRKDEAFLNAVSRTDSTLLIGLDEYSDHTDIYSRWYGVGLATIVVNRLISMEKLGKQEIQFELSASDAASLSVGDNIKVESSFLDTGEWRVWALRPQSRGTVQINASLTPFRAGGAGRFRVGRSRIGGRDSFV